MGRAIYLIVAAAYGIFAPISILVKFWPVDHMLSVTAALACVFVAGYIWEANYRWPRPTNNWRNFHG